MSTLRCALPLALRRSSQTSMASTSRPSLLQGLARRTYRRTWPRRMESNGGNSKTSLQSPSSKPTTNPKAETTTAAETEAMPEDPSELLFLGTYMVRLAGAFGLVYVFTEYGVDLTICEGPSMVPTIKPRGEIILIDRLTPRLYGIQGGAVGQERERNARQLQRLHQRREQDTNELGHTWYEPRIPVDRLPTVGSWQRFWDRTFSPVSVGDVVVIQHPDGVRTVCKRIMGLPGDVVLKASIAKRYMDSDDPRVKRRHLKYRGYVIPDGQMWVEGDNPWNSSDSRNYGAVPTNLIIGRVLFRIWPIRGSAMMERGARPESIAPEGDSLLFAGSVVLPAGYDNQDFVEEYKTRNRQKD